MPGWWFGTFFIFHNIWDNPSRWETCFKMVIAPPTRNAILGYARYARYALFLDSPIFRLFWRNCPNAFQVGTCFLWSTEDLCCMERPIISIGGENGYWNKESGIERASTSDSKEISWRVFKPYTLSFRVGLCIDSFKHISRITSVKL